MRDIKFRVYDKVMEEMMLPCQWEENTVGGGVVEIGLYVYRSPSDKRQHSSLSWILHHPESFTVEQSTGLKDENRKYEVFAGDQYMYRGEIFTVIWDEKRAGFCLENDGLKLDIVKIYHSSFYGTIHDKEKSHE